MTTPLESEVSPFLQGNFAPVRDESAFDDLEVVGAIPRELNGTFYRNGPNPAFEPRGRYHWFDGDGMIHAVTLEDGRARYRNRWVESQGLREERAAGKALFPGLLDFGAGDMSGFKVTANTNIVAHAGKLLALVEASLPTAMVPCTLETAGLYDFGGKLGGPMTAHPKLDPETGEMLFFGYSPFPPYLQYHVADPTGALARSEVIDVAWPSMMHDFAVTRDHVVFMLCPVVFSFEDMAARGGAFSWEPERGARLGVMPRGGGNADVRWFDIDPCYVFHPMNAYDDGGAVVLDVCRYERLLFMGAAASRESGASGQIGARLHRWRIDLAGGGVTSTPLDDLDGEFPRVDERRVGLPHRFGYVACKGPEAPEGGPPIFTAIRKYDLERGRHETRAFGALNGCGEPLFVPRHAGAAEDDGWVLVLAYDHERDRSDLVVLDARALDDDPVARIRIPRRVPYGFHGNWVAAQA